MSLQPESAMNGSFLSGGLQLARYLVKPSGKTGALLNSNTVFLLYCIRGAEYYLIE
jgi:hypothetical protein